MPESQLLIIIAVIVVASLIALKVYTYRKARYLRELGYSFPDFITFLRHQIAQKSDEVRKKKIGDGYYLELDDINDEYPIDMYVICTIKEEIWVKDVQNYSWNFLNEWYDDSHKYEDVDEILMDLGSNYDEFDAYMQKKCEGSYFDGNLVRRALEKSRIYPEFILAYKKLYANDYKQWWRIRKKYRHRLV